MFYQFENMSTKSTKVEKAVPVQADDYQLNRVEENLAKLLRENGYEAAKAIVQKHLEDFLNSI